MVDSKNSFKFHTPEDAEMADSRALLNEVSDEEKQDSKPRKTTRVASIDVFRGISVSLMIFVDYGGSFWPVIAHCPWNGLHLADFVMPCFLFVAGFSTALGYQKVLNKGISTWKAIIRANKLFFLGLILQGGYFHGASSLTFGVDIKRMRLLGILQRISIGYIIAALCEIWISPRRLRIRGFFLSYFWQWCVAALLSAIYLGLSYGLFVPDWQFNISNPTFRLALSNNSHIYTVKCNVRGDLGPACNSAGMIDRYFLGIDHLYTKSPYKNLKECTMSVNSPSWCHTPFDPEGILSSFTAAVTCIFGLQYGHILSQTKDHKDRINNWLILSVSIFFMGLFLYIIGIPLNKSLYSLSYMSLTTGFAGITFCVLYILVDVHGWRRLSYPFEWMGVHSQSIFILVTSNVLVLVIQGFYWSAPENNVINWILTCFARR